MIQISKILKPTGVKVARLTYSGTDDTYITYQFYNEYGEAFAENKEIATSYSIQVDIYTKGDFTALAEQVMELMTEAGFYRTYATEAVERYDNGTIINHKIIRFQYCEEHLN